VLCSQLPSRARDSWRDIPWEVSLVDAMHRAQREGKLLAMVVRSGHPLGCTCNNGLVDRAVIINDPEISTLLRRRFVPVAIDQHIHRRLEGAEGKLFADLVQRAVRFPELSAQGFYVMSSAGELIGFHHTQDPLVVRRMLWSALDAHAEDSPSDPVPANARDRFSLDVPDGAAVLDVVSKVLGGYSEPLTPREKALQESYGRDHCWVRSDEVLELARGVVPPSLLTRIARFHLVDNTRGEPPMWRADQVRHASATLDGGRLEGSVEIGTAGAQRGYTAALFGYVRAEADGLKDFDVVVRGGAWGRGYYNGGAPRGKYPLAIRFTLTEGAWPFDAIPPGAARTRRMEYLGMPTTMGK
jgi:hypothetical protein